MLEIKYEYTGEILNFDQFWLRDHCRCLECYNEVTKQRKYNLLDLPDDIAVKHWHSTEDGKLLKVKCRKQKNFNKSFIFQFYSF